MSRESVFFLIGWFLGFPIYQILLKPHVEKWLDKKYPL